MRIIHNQATSRFAANGRRQMKQTLPSVSTHLRSLVCLMACGFVLSTGAAPAADWAGFRGSHGNGLADSTPVPLRWDTTTNIRWKIPLPQPCNGSPIVVGTRVFFTCAEDNEGRRRTLYCVDAATGKSIWSRTVDFDRTMPTHETNRYCGTTPASNGKLIVVWHGSAGLHCYDMDGKPQWELELGEFRHTWGYGTSPVIDGDQVILSTGPGKEPFVAAYDLKTGKQRWKLIEARPGKADRTTTSTMYGSWSTPILRLIDGRKQLICCMPTRVLALAPETGKEIWSCTGLNHDRGDLAYSSPIVAANLVFVHGGFHGVAMAIKLGGRGDVTETHRLWRTEPNPQNIGTGLYIDGYVYRPNAKPTTIECIEPKTGKIIWKERAGKGEHWGSMVRIGEHAMVTNRKGATIVFKPSPDGFKSVATNPSVP